MNPNSLKIGFDACKSFDQSNEIFDSEKDVLPSLQILKQEIEQKKKKNDFNNMNINLHYDLN
jgi:hypothetical protein